MTALVFRTKSAKWLFQRNPSVAGGSGYGLSIARELSERNGAALKLSDRVRGTEFTIELQGADPADRQIAKARRPQRVE